MVEYVEADFTKRLELPPLAVQVGLTEPRLLARMPSRYLGSIYSAVSLAP